MDAEKQLFHFAGCPQWETNPICSQMPYPSHLSIFVYYAYCKRLHMLKDHARWTALTSVDASCRSFKDARAPPLWRQVAILSITASTKEAGIAQIRGKHIWHMPGITHKVKQQSTSARIDRSSNACASHAGGFLELGNVSCALECTHLT